MELRYLWLIVGSFSFLLAAAQAEPPIPLGAIVPDLELRSLHVDAVPVHGIHLQEILGARPSVLIVGDAKTCFEGQTCPLGQLKEVEPYLNRIGYQVIYVLGGRPPEAGDLNRARVSEFVRILWDDQFALARALGAVQAPDDRNGSAKRGVRPQAHVVPSIYVVGTDHRIRYVYSAVSPTVPLSGEVLLTAARVYKDAIVTETSGR